MKERKRKKREALTNDGGFTFIQKSTEDATQISRVENITSLQSS